ncbi:hypothetical protein IHE26_08940 [Plesiomonas shigelloides]|uniref:hypothetical protein n=1 Tax=Plesiomonas shigelloides TaxID=703 RepID=UPI00177D8730|nr:hypothetical protein [Plesiomonas shigelloides]QOH78580.1 hypothetical protein IHE26_08940 [Plesiomonas shigelloides]
MQYAKCSADSKVWEVSEFAKLPDSELEHKRRCLTCAECGEFAWYRRESYNGNPAHFCAHHHSDCTLKVLVTSSSDDNDDSSSETIIVRLEDEKGGSIKVDETTPRGDGSQYVGSARYISFNRNEKSPQQYTLRRILHKLVNSKEFRNSKDNIAFYGNKGDLMLSGEIRDVVVAFENITKYHDGKLKFYFGPIASCKSTRDGKIWLNSGAAYMSASVSVFQDIAQEFMKLFEVTDLDDFLGAYVLVAGTCNFSGEGNGKPIIWCGTPNYIFVRKYKEKAASLERDLILDN